MRELYAGLLAEREEYEAAVGAALAEAMPPRAPAALHADAIVDALAASGSVLAMGPISDAIWRAGWPAVAAAIGEVARDVAAISVPSALAAVVPEAAVRAAGPAEPGDGVALAAYDDQAGMVVLLSDYEPLPSSVAAFGTTVTVYGLDAPGRWAPRDMMASPKADAEAAMDDALRYLMPTAFHEDPWSISAEMPPALARAAVAGDERAAERCASLLCEALAEREADAGPGGADLGELVGTAVRASRSLAAPAGPAGPGRAVEREG